MKQVKIKQTPQTDAWEAYLDVEQYGKQTLSSIEFTTTHLCNMRCRHCAVGHTLTHKDAKALPIELLLQRLDEIPTLRTISITGGEPMMSLKSVENYVLPLLKYAHERGIYTQINSNLTLDLDRYKLIAPYLDVLHISHNWVTEDEFIDTGFAMMERKPTRQQRKALFDKMISNSKALSDMGVLVSAETMLNTRTVPHLEKIHKQVVEEMGCKRHEIHPMYDSGFVGMTASTNMQDSLHSMYPSDFASSLETLSLSEMRAAIHHLLDIRDKETWMLFGTLPFYPCSNNEEDLSLLKRLFTTNKVTVRNDPDGRSRLNVNIFSGEVIVTDFGDAPSLGNIVEQPLSASYETWMNSRLAGQLNCHCPSVQCLGPNVLVKNAYYPDTNFKVRKTNI
ncbi:radical SAM/CxCxxxxC motif protein YfkAB [Peribacillus cavernae]|uniref:Radical SAM/CxCxxxxC motif protein YfkAB n=1 Tax=Peribacillus cavernae TaxID=1674310 RepID=A0A433HB39_9BACI|nr:radical SAM/CxCxxxxC motif protein YfkAB [Peribacillus cavernae]MDQ0220397.1 organic radical activating enzyme [Peribacillus cavernae]RUQ25517.1 radical SAM/CxCxxxxC motif protein YfkAB [Peribacillus cavernae]